ncbi:MAG: TetR/AcrR family transcriptional regulator [Acidobacteriaceae bacterium]
MAKAPATLTRERILQQGVDLMSTSGLAGVTLGVLAQRTGISKSGLFAHFGSREEVQLGLLEQSAHVARGVVVGPAMRATEGLSRLKAVVRNWFGWTAKAGLTGGCPVAAGMFELDDIESPVRERLKKMESEWRGLLGQLTRQAIEHGELRANLDIDQFVWELCGIYLSHHASLRFVRDPRADERAHRAFEALVDRSRDAAGGRKATRRKKLS